MFVDKLDIRGQRLLPWTRVMSSLFFSAPLMTRRGTEMSERTARPLRTLAHSPMKTRREFKEANCAKKRRLVDVVRVTVFPCLGGALCSEVRNY